MADHSETYDELNRLVRVLREQTNKLEHFARNAVDSEVAHKIAYAKTILEADGPVAEREAKATEASANLLRQRRIDEELLRVQREKILSIRTAIEAMRSLNASERSLEPFSS